MFHAKKSLGQHWLRSKRAAELMVRAADLHPDERVLEIGPGRGFLTKFLLASGARVVAVEKDIRAIPLLEKIFAVEIQNSRLKLFHQDILELGPAEFNLEKYKLVANIPYYLTGQIIRQFLETEPPPERVVLMLQNEVAKRIVAGDGKESLLSISVKVYGTPKYVAKVPAKYFSPVPKADSAILLIGDINKNNLTENNLAAGRFFDLVKRGFGSKRKMLKNNLALKPETWLACGIDPKIRAENLTLNQWLCLASQ